jgi:diphthine synthase
MCALFFIGLGIYGAKGISMLGVDIMKRCQAVYLEGYTSPVEKNVIETLGIYIGKEIQPVKREFVEDGRVLIDQATKQDVAFITPGDPMIATTHIDLRIRAESMGVETQVIHSSSILSSVPGETGLHAYKFGKTVTITKSAPASMATVYDTIYENLIRGLHTIVLLEYDYLANSQLTPNEALKALIEYGENICLDILGSETLAIIASRLGSPIQSIVADRIQTLSSREYGTPPHVLIIPGNLHFTEVDALKALLKTSGTQICDNSQGIQRVAHRMVEKYVEKTRKALYEAHQKIKAGFSEIKGIQELLENVECYLSDSKRFLNQGKEELAILSIGYAEGLLDSLRYTHGIELNW